MKKMKSRGGFTVLEMLMTMMILSFSMVILTNGALTIRKIYSQALAKADAQMLLSQAETTLRNELSFAREYKTGEDDYLTEYTIYAHKWSLEPPEFQERFIQSDNQRRLEGISLAPVLIKYDDGKGCFIVESLSVIINDAPPLTLTAEPFSIRALSLKPVATESGG